MLSPHAIVEPDGRLQLERDFDLSEGEEVIVVVQRLTPEVLAAEDAAWANRFKKQPEVLTRIFERGRREIAAGEVVDFDPAIDEL